MFINAPDSMVIPGDIFLLGVLNSRLADYYIKNLGVTRNGGYFAYKPMFVSKTPIPIPGIKERENIELLVTEILNKKVNSKDIDEIDDELNSCIYKLYSLSETEINFIENDKCVGLSR